jgi:hypothetical protein
VTLGADLLILAVDEKRGTVRAPEHLRFVLAAADLVDLACRRRVEAEDRRIHVVEHLRTGDRALDTTLARLTDLRKGPDIDPCARRAVGSHAASPVPSL